MLTYRMRAETVRVTAEEFADEHLAKAAIGLAAEYGVISQARRALAPELRIVWDENSQAGTDEMWTSFIDDLRTHAENCGTLSDRTTNATAKFVLAVHAFELMQEAEVLEHFRSTAKARQPFTQYFEIQTVSPEDFERALCGRMDRQREPETV